MYNLSPFHYTYTAKSLKPRKIFLEEHLQFNRNEIIAIVGPSGGGKSTLLKILKGIIPEYSSGVMEGDVLFHGKSLSGESFQENLKKILYLFQNPFSQLIYPTPEEEFLFSMENFNYSHHEMSAEKEKFEELFNLEKIWGKKNSQLSNGECQKLVLASLLAINPEVLLLDEPTAFLDPNARREFYHFLNKIKGDRLVVIVDHHVDEIRDLVSRVIEVSKEGRISPRSDLDFSANDSYSSNLDLSDFLTPRKEQLRLTLDEVSFSYSKIEPLFKNLNLTITGGEILAVKGRNGIGKSTLMKVISGIIRPDIGNVRLDVGINSFKNLKIFPNVGFIFQNPETHFFFDTVEEELKQSFKNFSSEDLKNHLLERFFHDIDLKKSPFLLSEGEKRRLSILMTVFLGKTLIIYDEPTFGQDKRSTAEIAQLMKELQKSGIIQICISHDDEFIKNTAGRVFELSHGSLNAVS